ncbi:MAG: YihY/virulence factor BrkB family protein [Pseudomonadota bacterium]
MADRPGENDARSPTEHRGRVWWAAAKGVIRQIEDKRLSLIAAGVAFYGLLAIFPTLAAMIALWGLLGDPVDVIVLFAQFQSALPADIFKLINDQLVALANADGDTLGLASLLSLGFAIWSSRAGVAAMIQGVNVVYGERNRPGLWHYLHAVRMTVLLLAVGVVAIAALVIAPIALAFVNLGPLAGLIAEFVRWSIALGVFLLGFGLIYRQGPNRRPVRMAWITPGAALAVVLSLAASAGFAIYLANFGNYNEVYGSIGAVIATLMWLYITAFLVLIGAALNAELERYAHPDSTVGPDRPPGARGAAVADEMRQV